MTGESLGIAATGERATHAAEIKVGGRISYTDAFAFDLAMDSPDHILVTADYDFNAVEDLARIEFLASQIGEIPAYVPTDLRCTSLRCPEPAFSPDSQPQ
jgi:hypothetical protein